MLFLPAPLYGLPLRLLSPETPREHPSSLPFTDLRLIPHYPAKSPLDSILLKVVPGADAFITEKYAYEITQLLTPWKVQLRRGLPALTELAKFLDDAIETSSLHPTREITQRSGHGIEVLRRRFPGEFASGRERFLREIESYLSPFSQIETVECEIVGIQESVASPSTFDIEIRYDLVGMRKDGAREQRVGHWLTRWSQDETRGWRALRWQATEETLARAREPIFIDVSAQAFFQTASYQEQMLRGVDHWRTVMDGAIRHRRLRQQRRGRGRLRQRRIR